MTCRPVARPRGSPRSSGRERPSSGAHRASDRRPASCRQHRGDRHVGLGVARPAEPPTKEGAATHREFREAARWRSCRRDRGCRRRTRRRRGRCGAAGRARRPSPRRSHRACAISPSRYRSDALAEGGAAAVTPSRGPGSPCHDGGRISVQRAPERCGPSCRDATAAQELSSPGATSPSPTAPPTPHRRRSGHGPTAAGEAAIDLVGRGLQHDADGRGGGEVDVAPRDLARLHRLGDHLAHDVHRIGRAVGHLDQERVLVQQVIGEQRPVAVRPVAVAARRSPRSWRAGPLGVRCASLSASASAR